MAVVLDQFVKSLSESGIMTTAEVETFISRLPENERPTNGQEMGTLLYRHGRLTKFQAQAVYRGAAKGLILGDYVILDEIGRGDMGRVYKAEHRRMKRIVALKVLPGEMTDSADAVRRFQQEVEAAARLNHNNIVTAFDAGETKKTHFLVMEYVDGQSLADLVAQCGRQSVANALDYVLQVARGLEYSHGEGVIHRDIKPSNLLLDKNGTVKILDMGLARVDRQVGQQEETADCGLTQSGDVMGTVDYMSPEQAASSKHVDERTDVYSLGCTWFYLLTGKPMYPGGTLVERVLAHREKPIPVLKKERSDVPQSMCGVFRRMVAKKVEFRYRSMKEVIHAIEQCDALKSQQAATAPASELQPANETPTASRAIPCESTVRHPSSPPPPPSLTARDRSSVPSQKKASRHKKIVAQTKAAEKQKSREQAWTNAVDDAVREQKSKARWNKLRRIFGAGVAGATKWLLLLAVCGGLAGGSYYIWRNTERLLASRESAQSGINEMLQRSHFDAVSSFEFTHTSILRPLPETLEFEQPLFQTNTGSSAQTSTLKGQFDRTNGIVKIFEPFTAQMQSDPVL